MKVYIGPYKNWYGSWQIAERIPFLNEDQQEKLGHWISHSRIKKVLDWINNLRGDRKIKVRIDEHDTWSMDNTLAHIILPMLKQLKATKHGSPIVDDEDLPPEMRYNDVEAYDDSGVWIEPKTNWVHHRWDWVLNEMIWSFEQELDDSWEDRFYHGKPEYKYTNVRINGEELTEISHSDHFIATDDDETDWVQMDQVNPDYWVDYEGMKRYNDRIQNGFRLFGKYYSNLWD